MLILKIGDKVRDRWLEYEIVDVNEAKDFEMYKLRHSNGYSYWEEKHIVESWTCL